MSLSGGVGLQLHVHPQRLALGHPTAANGESRLADAVGEGAAVTRRLSEM
jgi:hypothetical protein